MIVYAKTNKFQVICPICKKREIIGIPESRLKKNSPLTTISIHKGLICQHHFQFFLDKSFRIRGYQKVDLELQQESSKNLRNGIKVFNQNKDINKANFENLVLEGDKIKQIPISKEKNKKNKLLKQAHVFPRKKKSLKEIYEEFWEFIDDGNKIFLDYITNDKRRTKISIQPDFEELCIT